MSARQPGPYDDVARKWHALAVRRQMHVEELRDSGRWRHYYDWDELIEATESGALDWSGIPLEQIERAYSLGQAYAAKNDQGKLGLQIDALKKQASGAAKSALSELEGLRLLARGEIGPAFDQFAKAPSISRT